MFFGGQVEREDDSKVGCRKCLWNSGMISGGDQKPVGVGGVSIISFVVDSKRAVFATKYIYLGRKQ